MTGAAAMVAAFRAALRAFSADGQLTELVESHAILAPRQPGSTPGLVTR
jgi:hypothetical protein